MEFYVAVRNGGKTLRALRRRERKNREKEKSRGVRESKFLYEGPSAQLFCSFELLICLLLSRRAISLKAHPTKIPTRREFELSYTRIEIFHAIDIAVRVKEEDKDGEMNKN